MQFLENFMLAHPFLMSREWDHYTGVLIFLLFASFGCFAAFYNSERTTSWSLAHGKYFRLAYIFFALTFFVEAYGSWRHPGVRDIFYPLLEGPLIFVSFVLLVIAMYLEVHYRQAAKIQDGNSQNTQP